MKHKAYLLFVFATVILLIGAGGAAAHWSGLADTPAAPAASLGTTAPLGAAFTYQGRLTDGGGPAEGDYDFKFRLYDDPDSGEGSLAGTVPLDDQLVSDGLFTVALDFGEVFDGTAYWLEIAVRPGGSDGDYTTLDQRQAITAAPYALYARSIPLAGSGSAATAARSDHVHAGSDYANVVTVAKSGADYSSVQTAIDSITDASATNPYLVWVAPGLYEEAVTMKPHVHLQGAGQQVTVISSDASDEFWPPTKATLVLSEHVSLRDLSLVNEGTGDYRTALLANGSASGVLVANISARVQGSGKGNYAIFLEGSSTQVTMQAVNALAQDGDIYNISLYNYNSASATLQGGSFTGNGGGLAIGIYLLSAPLEAFDVTALGENGSSENYGLYNYSSSATLRGGSFSGRGGEYALGIYNFLSANLEAFDVSALATGAGTDNYGIRCHGGEVNVANSYLEGDDYSLNRTDGTVTLSHSRLVGDVAGSVTCVAVSEGTTFYQNTCP